MNTTETAPQAAIEQIPPGTQAQQEQAPVPTQAPSPAPAQQAAQSPSADEIATLRAQASKAAQLEESYNQLRADHTRKSQALAALGGAQPPQQDPLTPYLKTYHEAGFTGEDAKFLATRDYQTDQRFSHLQSTMLAQQQIPMVMQTALQCSPTLVQYPEALQAAETELRNALNS